MNSQKPLTPQQMDDLNRMYGIIMRNGKEETERLMNLAVEHIAERPKVTSALTGYNGWNSTASHPDRPVTYVPSEDGYTTITTQVDDTVYVLHSGRGTYSHTLHRVRRIVNNVAVTYCLVWARGGTVMPKETDHAVWCTSGCKDSIPRGEG